MSNEIFLQTIASITVHVIIYPFKPTFELILAAVKSNNFFSPYVYTQLILFFKWANPGLSFVYFQSFQTNNTIFTTNQCEKLSIQYAVPGFEPTTFST